MLKGKETKFEKLITIEAPRLYNVHKSTLDASSTQWRHFQTRSRSGILLSNRWILLSLHYCLRVAASCFKQSWTRCIVCSSAERIVVPNHCLVHARRVRFCIRSLLQRDSHVARLSHTYIPTHNPRSSLHEKINYIYIFIDDFICDKTRVSLKRCSILRNMLLVIYEGSFGSVCVLRRTVGKNTLQGYRGFCPFCRQRRDERSVDDIIQPFGE